MRVQIIVHWDEEDDAVSGTMTISRDDVDTLNQLAHFYEMAAVAMGFTYVDGVGLSKGQGEVVWSNF
jgi:hypothetical protein